MHVYKLSSCKNTLIVAIVSKFKVHNAGPVVKVMGVIIMLKLASKKWRVNIKKFLLANSIYELYFGKHVPSCLGRQYSS